MDEQKFKKIIFDKEENIISIEELIENSEHYNIKNIAISKDIIFNSNTIFINTDYKPPLKVVNGTLSINEEYYHQHKQEIDNLIKIICKKTTKDNINILDKCFIDDELITILSQNDYLQNIMLTLTSNKNKKNQYCLTKSDYEKFKKSNI